MRIAVLRRNVETAHRIDEGRRSPESEVPERITSTHPAEDTASVEDIDVASGGGHGIVIVVARRINSTTSAEPEPSVNVSNAAATMGC